MSFNPAEVDLKKVEECDSVALPRPEQGLQVSHTAPPGGRRAFQRRPTGPRVFTPPRSPAPASRRTALPQRPDSVQCASSLPAPRALCGGPTRPRSPGGEVPVPGDSSLVVKVRVPHRSRGSGHKAWRRAPVPPTQPVLLLCSRALGRDSLAPGPGGERPPVYEWGVQGAAARGRAGFPLPTDRARGAGRSRGAAPGKPAQGAQGASPSGEARGEPLS